MNGAPKKPLYPLKDTFQILCGIPMVATVAIFCADFVTSYSGV